MCSVIVIILFASVAQAHSIKELTASNRMGELQENINKLVDKLVDKLLGMSGNLDHMTLGMSGNLAIRPCTGPLSSRPKGHSGSVASFQLRSPRPRRDCGIFCAAGHNDDTQMRATTTKLCSRRQASLATFGGLMAVAVQPTRVMAEEAQVAEEAQKEETTTTPIPFIDGPEGLKFQDLIMGDSTIKVMKGDDVSVNFEINVAGGGKVGSQKGFKILTDRDDIVIKGWNMAMVGAGVMPPMNLGGKRKVLIPSALAYGSQGLNCNIFGCTVPPDSTVEITIELVSVNA